jgi:pimeloyl-ACP methyl ester carboxylesterase
MPYSNNHGVRIHYDVIGTGSPLVLHHGTLGSWEDWPDFGYVDVLQRDHQLILLDARGHGASDKPHEPGAYDLRLRVADVTSVLDELQIPQAHYFGYSLGGWVGFGLATYAPERLTSLILGGAHPYAEKMQAFRRFMSPIPLAFLAFAESVFGHYATPARRKRLLANDLKALKVLTQDRTSLADVLPTIHTPCLLFAGEDDPRFPLVREGHKHIANATFVSLPGCDHIAALAQSELVLPHVVSFLNKLRERSHS